MRRAPTSPEPAADRLFARDTLLERLRGVRARTLALAAPLSPEDQCIQSMPDASPTKWHLAHTTWFFEAVVLGPHAAGYRCFDERFSHLFNSYYESLGSRHPRPQRGMLTRPSAETVRAYRVAVDGELERFIERCDAATWAVAAPLIELGANHEEQHQELLLTDIKHALSLNPLRPAYLEHESERRAKREGAATWLRVDGGDFEIGAEDGQFAFDNERPRHVARVESFELARELVSNREFQRFVDDGGYRRPELWLSDGWAAVNANGWNAPEYWLDRSREAARAFTLYGARELDPDAPVAHVSFYEAAAYAEWSGARLPTEFEWEVAARLGGADREPAAGLGAVDASGAVSIDPQPRASRETDASGMHQPFGAVWQWTRSSYDPYPRFRPLAGAVGEYNGKFMVGQIVLRGGSCVTPRGHSRVSYRNFFPPATRWQFSGLRLARDV